MWTRKDRSKKDRVGNFLYGIFGPATVEGAMQGWSQEARDQYKQMRAAHKRAAQQRRAESPDTTPDPDHPA